jgi:hypothetical protein
MRKRTRERLERMEKEISDLRGLLWEIANAADLVRLPEVPPTPSHYVKNDSEEAKAFFEKQRVQQEAFAKLAQMQTPYGNFMNGMFGF